MSTKKLSTQALEIVEDVRGAPLTSEEHDKAKEIAEREDKASGGDYSAPHLAFLVCEQMGFRPEGTPESFTLPTVEA